MRGGVGHWLETLGLGEHAKMFAENAVTIDLLPELTEQDLRELGVAKLGQRKRLLDAIAALSGPDDVSAQHGVAAAVRSGAEAERRQLTVMFCDLVGSTELSRQLDPEDLRDLMRRYQDAVAGPVARYGGHVAKFLGDGVLVYFGWPLSYEDQAERAVRAGLGVVGAVERVPLDSGESLRTRVGIATGRVVVGDLIGESATEAEAVSGETPNLAARLQGIAAPSQVVVGAITHRLIGTTFEVEDLGRQNLKGFSEAVGAWRIIGEGRAESRFEAARGATLTPIVGRAHELGLLEARWELAKGGEGQVVVMSGEAGIGKSRMVQALRDQVADQRHFRLRYQCSPHHTSSALYPVIQRLERAAGFSARDQPNDKLDKLQAFLEPSGEGVEAVVPLFASLLSVPAEDRYGALDMSPEQRRDRTIEAMVGQILALSRKRPLLIVLEDAHWIDPTTEVLLGEIMAQIEDSAALLLVTHRPQYAPPWTGHPHLTSVTLNRLGREQGAEIVRTVGGPRLTPNVIDRIVARADGVPLYLEELTTSVVEADVPAGDAAAGDVIPITLHASLSARLDRLGETKEVARIGAVIGRSFPRKLIAAVAGISEELVDNALERIVESGLMSRRGVPPEAIYTFKHALIQDAAYEALLRSKRHEYHAKVADVLLQDFADQAETEPEVVARHLSLAKLPERAVAFWLRAGQRAAERSAHVEAVANLESGLREIEQLPESQSRDEQEFALRIALGASMLTAKGWSAPDVEKNYARAQELGVSGGDSHQLFTALGGVGNVNLLRGEIKVARRIADRMLAIALDQDETALLLQGYRAVGLCCLLAGDFGAAREHLQRGNALFDASHHHAPTYVYGTDPAVIGLSLAGWVNWFLGDPEEARSNVDAALGLAEEIQHPFSHAYARGVAASLHQACRNPEAALEHAEAAIAIAEEHDYPYWVGWATVLRGWALAALGHPNQGIGVLQHGLEVYGSTGAVQIKPYVLTLLAEMYGWAGQPDKGLEVLDGAVGGGNKTDVRFYEAEALRIKGELLRQAGTGDGRKYFERALKLSHRQRARALELRAAVSAGRAALERGEGRSIHALIAPLYRTFDSDLSDPDLADARALLDTSGAA